MIPRTQDALLTTIQQRLGRLERRVLKSLNLEAELDSGTFDTRFYTKEQIDALAIQGQVPSGTIVGGGGSATIYADGLIEFTAVSFVTFLNVFTGLDKDKYRCVGAITAITGTSVGLFHRLSTSIGTDVAGTGYNYAYTLKTDWSTTGTFNGVTGAGVFGYVFPSGITSGFAHADWDYELHRPNQAVTTLLRGRSTARFSGLTDWKEGSDQTTQTAYPSLSLVASGTTPRITGWAKIVKEA